MVFSSATFLFLFLPLVILGYLAVGARARNLFLMLMSALFYLWGDAASAIAIGLCLGCNYPLGLLIERTRSRRILLVGVAANVCLLAWYKYAGFIYDLGVVLYPPLVQWFSRPQVILPIGVSFFTFQGISYLVDIYRRDSAAAHNPIQFALFKLFFPQLIAGPIVRYVEISESLQRPLPRSWQGMYAGTECFVLGLAKKVLLANTLGEVASTVFDGNLTQVSQGAAWLALTCYGFQLYFDFSGYSDMAVGLGRIFGLQLPQNFAYPYAATSVTEFWRRWHITLSRWFRDYLYVPLGGNRRGVVITVRNLVIVFLLCGLWHGASLTFVVWGLYHGILLLVERLYAAGGFNAWLSRRYGILVSMPLAMAGRMYTVLAVFLGWVLFRAASWEKAILFYERLLHSPKRAGIFAKQFLLPDLWTALLIGAVGATPFAWWLYRKLPAPVQGVMLLVLFVVSAGLVCGSSYNPFIYFQF